MQQYWTGCFLTLFLAAMVWVPLQPVSMINIGELPHPVLYEAVMVLVPPSSICYAAVMVWVTPHPVFHVAVMVWVPPHPAFYVAVIVAPTPCISCSSNGLGGGETRTTVLNCYCSFSRKRQKNHVENVSIYDT